MRKITRTRQEIELIPNSKLDKVEFLYKDLLHAPESLADDSKFIYTSVHDGIVKLAGNNIVLVVKFGKPCKDVYQEGTCGRPLGIRFGQDGYLYAADADYGIYRVDVNTESEDFLLVAETSRNRILRYHLKGPKAGASDIFLDGLPGMPDNIQTDGGSGFIVNLVSEANSERPNIIQVFSQFPNVRKFFARSVALVQLVFTAINSIYPNEFAQNGVHFVGHLEPLVVISGRTAVLHVSESGVILDSLWSNNNTIGYFCEAHIVEDQLYLSSPFNRYLGRIALSKVGWEHLKRKSDSLLTKKQKCLKLKSN
ncbi:hypothetical protein HHI36_001303 [Cryptolaemus montrouzieri]|uniref:Adipocyte plasma membrane-associated protein n=1 Tax=Cryptolaemus montrouzieri TaxID=559131 RepID=A0ABD2P7Y4_9CUCU